MPFPPRPSIPEIARAAGVSPILVGYYLSGPPEHAGAIDADASARIAAALDSTGFAAAVEAHAETCHVLYVTEARPDLRSRLRAERTASALREHGVPLAVTAIGGVADLPALAPLLRRHITALVVECEDGALPALRGLALAGRPMVAVGPSTPDARFDVVSVDDSNAIRDAMLHLVDHGYEAFALISRRSDSNLDHRTTVARDALRALGIPPDCIATVYSGADPVEAAAAIQPVLGSRDRPTAVVAGSDESARGVLWACLRHGVTVPGEIAVLGHGDAPESAITDPPLSTIGPDDAAATVADLLVARLADPSLPGRHVIESWRFLPRASTGA